MVATNLVKVLKRCRVAPPSGSIPVPPLALPLTAFDLFFSSLKPVQRLYFYPHPGASSSSFLISHIPKLKSSLSVALQSFYHLAGNLVPAPGNLVPSSLQYSEGDSVALTVAECADDFLALTRDDPKDAARLRCLAPDLPASERGHRPALALQATLFPGKGIAIGTTTHHSAVDGSSSLHFMRTWASICRGDAGGAGAELPAPFFDRSVIQDPVGLGSKLLAHQEEKRRSDGVQKYVMSAHDISDKPGVVHATFPLGKPDLEGLRRWVTSKDADFRGTASMRYSSFSLAAALAWTSTLKARGVTAASVPEWFLCPYELRGRFEGGAAIPKEYFGNCLGAALIESSRRELVGENAVAVAAAAIRDAVQGVRPEGVIGGLAAAVRFFMEGKGTPFSVAGSPRLGVYQVNFGWGKPKKVEMVFIETTGSMSLAEKSGERDGLEVGMALPTNEMEKFAGFFADGLRRCTRSI